MFPFKKKNPENITEQKTENVAKKGIKTMDTVITGVILSGIIASLYGVKMLRDKKPKHTEDIQDDHSK